MSSSLCSILYVVDLIGSPVWTRFELLRRKTGSARTDATGLDFNIM
jgi:hypothetical protein